MTKNRFNKYRYQPKSKEELLNYAREKLKVDFEIKVNLVNEKFEIFAIEEKKKAKQLATVSTFHACYDIIADYVNARFYNRELSLYKEFFKSKISGVNYEL